MKPDRNTIQASSRIKRVLQRLFRLLLLSSIALTISGCPGDFLNDDSDDYNYRPIYLAYDDLRSSVAVQNPRSVNRIGRVYLYGSYFFLNEKNSGIHVFNNTDPTVPVNTAFINIPGNTELSIKDGFLYADSYVDLVTLDLNNPADIKITARSEGVFPWDPYQNIENPVFFSYDQLDESRGVIIGYE